MKIQKMMDGKIMLKDGALIVGVAKPHGNGYTLSVKQQNGQYAKGWAYTEKQARHLLEKWGDE